MPTPPSPVVPNSPPNAEPRATQRAAEPAGAATVPRDPHDPRLTYPMTPPDTAVRLRDGAVVDAGAVRVLQEEGVKYNTFPSRPGYPRGGADLRTHLHVEAWVRNTTFEKRVWADAHVYTHDGTLAHAETLPLEYARPAGDGGDVFAIDRALYQGAAATPGSVTLRPDARVIEYRLYCALGGRTVTDGTLHACYLKPDVATG